MEKKYYKESAPIEEYKVCQNKKDLNFVLSNRELEFVYSLKDKITNQKLVNLIDSIYSLKVDNNGILLNLKKYINIYGLFLREKDAPKQVKLEFKKLMEQHMPIIRVFNEIQK